MRWNFWTNIHQMIAFEDVRCDFVTIAIASDLRRYPEFPLQQLLWYHRAYQNGQTMLHTLCVDFMIHHQSQNMHIFLLTPFLQFHQNDSSWLPNSAAQCHHILWKCYLKLWVENILNCRFLEMMHYRFRNLVLIFTWSSLCKIEKSSVFYCGNETKRDFWESLVQ